MIKIIKGVYGRKRYDSNSGVISLTPEEEARLIKIGVAVGVAVEETAAADGEGEPTDGAETQTDGEGEPTDGAETQTDGEGEPTDKPKRRRNKNKGGANK